MIVFYRHDIEQVLRFFRIKEYGKNTISTKRHSKA